MALLIFAAGAVLGQLGVATAALCPAKCNVARDVQRGFYLISMSYGSIVIAGHSNRHSCSQSKQ